MQAHRTVMRARLSPCLGKGAVNPDAMRRALHTLKRHERTCPYRYVLKHGEPFEAAPLPKPHAYRRFRAQGGCFANAARLALHHDALTYVEGYGWTRAAGDFPLLHAWCLNGDGRVVDPTWTEPTGYYGVRLPESLVREGALERGAYGSLLDDWERGFPLIRGETP